MYNHNKAQQSKNRVHISWDILYLIYCNEVRLACESHRNRLFLLQKRAVRLICHSSSKVMNTGRLFNGIGMLKLNNINQCILQLFMFHFHTTKIASYIWQYVHQKWWYSVTIPRIYLWSSITDLRNSVIWIPGASHFGITIDSRRSLVRIVGLIMTNNELPTSKAHNASASTIVVNEI